MDFKAATDRLMRAVRILDIAAAFGITENAIARWRVDPNKGAHREPSAHWQPVVARLARERARELNQLAEELDRAA